MVIRLFSIISVLVEAPLVASEMDCVVGVVGIVGFLTRLWLAIFKGHHL